MKMTYMYLSATLLSATLVPVAAHGVNLHVNCSGKGQLPTINGALKLLDPQWPNTLRVSGTCHENVQIQSFDRLTLIAAPGASINDASSGNSSTLTIVDSERISIQGFTITGGSPAVVCGNNSVCRFSGNTIQGASGDGVVFNRSHGDFAGDVIQNNAGRGIAVLNASRVITSPATVQGNGDSGIGVVADSFLFTDSGTLVQNNALHGVTASTNSILRMMATTISGNAADGVHLAESSVARFGFFGSAVDTITGNAGSGVGVGDLSFAFFPGGGAVVITGNNMAGGTFDVSCNPQFSATRGALTNLGGGTTNCSEP